MAMRAILRTVFIVLVFIFVDYLLSSIKSGKRSPYPAHETNLKIFFFQYDKNLMQSNSDSKSRKIPNGGYFEVSCLPNYKDMAV